MTTSQKAFDYIFGTISIESPKRNTVEFVPVHLLTGELATYPNDIAAFWNPFEFLSTKILSCDLALPNNIATFTSEIDSSPYMGRTQWDDAIEGIANYLLQQKNTIKEDTEVENAKKVTLKVGDTMCHNTNTKFNECHRIDGFQYGLINIDESGYIYPLTHQYYYVNGVKYAKENIIVPQQVVSENKELINKLEEITPEDIIISSTNEEGKDITPENILQTLTYNGIAPEDDNGDEVYRISSCGTALIITPHGFSSMVLNFSNPKWLQHVELEFGKLTPMPEHPKDLPTWVQLQSDASISVADAGVNYRIYVVGFFRALIPKDWSLERQIKAVQQLINIYKGVN